MQPANDVVVELKRYQESCSSDKVVNELRQLCEGTQQEMYLTGSEVVDKAVCEPVDTKNTVSSPVNDVAVSVSFLLAVSNVVFMTGTVVHTLDLSMHVLTSSTYDVPLPKRSLARFFII